MSSTVRQAKAALGHRLRELRKDARLTGVQLAGLAGWQSSKITKIEYGKQTPSEDDIRVWCEHAGALEHATDLVAAVRHIEVMYVEWRRNLQSGVRRRQQSFRKMEKETQFFRWYEPVLIPGILHTEAYARAVLGRVIDFYNIPNDLEEGVAARMKRQEILHSGSRRFHIVLAEQALWTVVGGPAVVREQLSRLITISTLARISLGVIPRASTYEVPTNGFIVFDSKSVHVETVTAELSITQPHEIFLYEKTFEALARSARYGEHAREMIIAAKQAHATSSKTEQISGP